MTEISGQLERDARIVDEGELECRAQVRSMRFELDPPGSVGDELVHVRGDPAEVL
jgi:hypothetical protein